MSNKIQVLVIAVFLVVSSPAFAAVYQCKSADGKIAFSDSPCDGTATGRKLEKFDFVITRKVSASVAHLGMTRRYVDGYAYWSKSGRELTAVLYPRNLSEQELAQVANGERLNTHAEESAGRVTLIFDGPRAGRNTLRHMRSVFTGFVADSPKTPWTSNHRKDDLAEVLQKFDLGKDDDNIDWLQFQSRESTENIRWQIEFALPVER